MFKKIKFWYDNGLWNKSMVERAVLKGVITRPQADEILKGE